MKTLPRKEFIRKLRALGFEGPRRVRTHIFMHRGSIYVRIPGAESPEISVGLQQALLRQLEIDMPIWEMA